LNKRQRKKNTKKLMAWLWRMPKYPLMDFFSRKDLDTLSKEQFREQFIKAHQESMKEKGL
jgi:ABC-type phosphate/phosphonate transport system substrate-binding protein